VRPNARGMYQRLFLSISGCICRLGQSRPTLPLKNSAEESVQLPSEVERALKVGDFFSANEENASPARESEVQRFCGTMLLTAGR
jgi:hypothetical protein